MQGEEIQALARQVTEASHSKEKRQEELWLSERFEDFLKASGMRSRQEGDRLLALRIGELLGEPVTDSPTAILKIRYWRTGRHYPKNRAACEAFGRALGLDAGQQRYLMTDWSNRSDRYFGPEDVEGEEYLRRKAILARLQQEFLLKQRPEELLAMCAPGTGSAENLRYIYCRQAFRYLGVKARGSISEPVSHLDTRAYEYQFGREMKLLGEVSRGAMIRHLLILGMPFVSRKRIDGWLSQLGYTPLCETHRLPNGGASDLLVLRLLEMYEKECTGWEPQACTEWFQQTAGLLDDALDEAGCAAANLFRFKHVMGGKNA